MIAPNDQSLCALNDQLYFRAHRQQHLGRYVAKRQTHQNLCLDLRLQTRCNHCQIKTTVVPRNQFVVTELAKNYCFLVGQYTRVQQVRQDALDALRVLAHVFYKQDSAFDDWQIWRTDQRGQNRQISTPKGRILDAELVCSRMDTG